MKKEYIKVNDLYILNGNIVTITAIHGDKIYAAEALFDDNGDLAGFVASTENILTDYEIKKLRW